LKGIIFCKDDHNYFCSQIGIVAAHNLGCKNSQLSALTLAKFSMGSSLESDTGAIRVSNKIMKSPKSLLNRHANYGYIIAHNLHKHDPKSYCLFPFGKLLHRWSVSSNRLD